VPAAMDWPFDDPDPAPLTFLVHFRNWPSQCDSHPRGWLIVTFGRRRRLPPYAHGRRFRSRRFNRETVMDQVHTKWFWDKVVCAGLLGLALTAGIAAGMRVAIILDRL
jgi:hypothetical protein